MNRLKGKDERERGATDASERVTEPELQASERATRRIHRAALAREPAAVERPRVDDVGEAARRLSVRAPRGVIPRLVAARATVAGAPIDSREAYLLSLVDGKTSATTLADITSMPEETVHVLLRRLARLGLVAL